MDWLKIASAVAIIMMMVFVFPRLRHAMKNTPKGTSSDWMSFVIPIALVALFVIVLAKMV